MANLTCIKVSSADDVEELLKKGTCRRVQCATQATLTAAQHCLHRFESTPNDQREQPELVSLLIIVMWIIPKQSQKRIAMSGGRFLSLRHCCFASHTARENLERTILTPVFTQANSTSSRSHAILTLEISPVHGGRRTCVRLVDLAGAERAYRSGGVHDARIMNQGSKINTSLSALSSVIEALAKGKSHVPYRDSKLTRVLQDSLGGTSLTTIITNVSPSVESFNDTLSSLRYAMRASGIAVSSVVNVSSPNPESILVRQLRQEIAELKAASETQRQSPVLTAVSPVWQSIHETAASVSPQKRSPSLGSLLLTSPWQRQSSPLFGDDDVPLLTRDAGSLAALFSPDSELNLLQAMQTALIAKNVVGKAVHLHEILREAASILEPPEFQWHKDVWQAWDRLRWEAREARHKTTRRRCATQAYTLALLHRAVVSWRRVSRVTRLEGHQMALGVGKWRDHNVWSGWTAWRTVVRKEKQTEQRSQYGRMVCSVLRARWSLSLWRNLSSGSGHRQVLAAVRHHGFRARCKAWTTLRSSLHRDKRHRAGLYFASEVCGMRRVAVHLAAWTAWYLGRSRGVAMHARGMEMAAHKGRHRGWLALTRHADEAKWPGEALLSAGADAWVTNNLWWYLAQWRGWVYNTERLAQTEWSEWGKGISQPRSPPESSLASGEGFSPSNHSTPSSKMVMPKLFHIPPGAQPTAFRQAGIQWRGGSKVDDPVHDRTGTQKWGLLDHIRETRHSMTLESTEGKGGVVVSVAGLFSAMHLRAWGGEEWGGEETEAPWNSIMAGSPVSYAA